MLPLKRRTSEHKAREEILRAVYEQNLAILGHVRPPFRKRKALGLRKSLLGAAAFFFAIVLQVEYTGISSPPAVRAGEAALVSPSGPPKRATVNPAIPTLSSSSKDALKDSEFKSMEGDRNVPVSRMLGLKIRTIMIDAGHGGSDSGTRGQMGALEKDLTLDIARRLKAHLMEHSGAHVLMTREGDYYVPLARRVELARQSRADLFISVHLNYLPSKPINIIETYYFGPSDDQKVIALAEQENAGSEYGLSDLRDIVDKLGRVMKVQESMELARSIQSTLFLNSRRHNEDVQNYGVKRAPFVVLVGVAVPAVLAEVSCLSNTEEERQLNSEGHRDNIARYLATGISAYLDKGALTHEARH